MNGLTPSNFKRIHLGLLLEFILAFVMAGLLVVLIAIVNSRIPSSDLPAATDSWAGLEDYAGIFMRLIYAYFILKYAISAICALITISGLGEAESSNADLHRAKLFFIGFLLINAIVMVFRIIRVAMADAADILDLPYIAVRMATVTLRMFALFFLMRGLTAILDSMGQPSHTDLKNSPRQIIVSFVLLMIAYCYLIIHTILGTKALLPLIPMVITFVIAGIYYLIIWIRVLKYTRQTVTVITDICS